KLIQNNVKSPWEMALKAIFLLQMGFGSLANIILFFHSISPILFGHKQRPTDTILTHTVIANLLVLLSSGIPHTMAAFAWRSPLFSLGCKFLSWPYLFFFFCFDIFLLLGQCGIYLFIIKYS
uniref:Vomeronasal type-1 receptor n=1 Tax=Catagonus wagneri TaxID=51154 RepID=A0A8C3YFP3_9CETA